VRGTCTNTAAQDEDGTLAGSPPETGRRPLTDIAATLSYTSKRCSHSSGRSGSSSAHPHQQAGHCQSLSCASSHNAGRPRVSAAVHLLDRVASNCKGCRYCARRHTTSCTEPLSTCMLWRTNTELICVSTEQQVPSSAFRLSVTGCRKSLHARLYPIQRCPLRSSFTAQPKSEQASGSGDSSALIESRSINVQLHRSTVWTAAGQPWPSQR
jgi:hypothetical protein